MKVQISTQKTNLEVTIENASTNRISTGTWNIEIEVEIAGKYVKFNATTNDMHFIDSLISKYDIEALFNYKEEFFTECIENYIYHNLED